MSNNSNSIKNDLKIIIIGSSGTGKTSLVKTISKGSFTDEQHSEQGKIKNYIIYL